MWPGRMRRTQPKMRNFIKIVNIFAAAEIHWYKHSFPAMRFDIIIIERKLKNMVNKFTGIIWTEVTFDQFIYDNYSRII